MHDVVRNGDGSHRGVAYADYADRPSAEYAIKVLDGFSLAGKTLAVQFEDPEQTLLSTHKDQDCVAAISGASGEVDRVKEAADAISRPYKVSSCRFFAQGSCKNGAQCTYAHGDEELRTHRDKQQQKQETMARARAQSFERELERQRHTFEQQLEQQRSQFQQQQQQQQMAQTLQQWQAHHQVAQQQMRHSPWQHEQPATLEQHALRQVLATDQRSTVCHQVQGLLTDDATCYLAIGPTNCDTTKEHVAQIVSSVSAVESVLLQPTRGYAIVRVTNIQEARSVRISLNGRILGQGPQQFQLRVEYVAAMEALVAAASIATPRGASTGTSHAVPACVGAGGAGASTFGNTSVDGHAAASETQEDMDEW